MSTSTSQTEIRFDGKVAIVTGAAQGMGREHSLLLGKRGAQVIVNDLDADGAESTAKAIRESGGDAKAVAGSIAERQVAQALVDTAIETWGRVDIVINNAGIEIKKDFPDFSDADFARMMDVHVWGTWRLTQIAWPHMQRQKYGRVLIVSSQSIFGMPQNVAYTTAKGALFALGRTLALEGQEHGIHVNMLGPVAGTAMAKQMLDGDEASYQWAVSQYPASATSAVVAWLVHEECTANGEFIASYGRGIGRVALTHSKGVVCKEEGEFTPEIARGNFERAIGMDGALILGSMQEVSDKIVSPGAHVDI
ncbi:hypothetical protein BHE90_010266 [Fusarium euwallaceae]|uniref:Ketoreductase domain-containing protein n=2 Tax=Fusarium solani species complex TaxID=232080 RepID=A0A430LHU3_9HYPO|nr:hypothetical protein CEP51_009464 [Fusarium floridanum]RTE75305.1 hypothetical protein BHE90_010266 [Fusarium euwallaceae]